MTRPSPGPTIHTFVVRFRREWSVAGPRWRGSIEHVESRERGAFLDLGGLVTFLRRFGVVVPAGDKDHISSPSITTSTLNDR
jgi:hypothetical protein